MSVIDFIIAVPFSHVATSILTIGKSCTHAIANTILVHDDDDYKTSELFPAALNSLQPSSTITITTAPGNYNEYV